MTKQKVTIKVDVHEDTEESQEIVPEIIAHPEVEDYILDKLEYGDLYVPESDLMVERKEMTDYASSLLEGRLPRQIKEMQSVCENVYVLIDGNLSESESLYHTNLSGESIRGHMASTMARKGVPVIPCSNSKLLVDMVVRLARKHIEEPSSNYVETGPVDIDRPVSERMYGSLSGIGSEVSHTLYKEFGPMRNLLNASQEELTMVNGIGDTLAESIYNELRGNG